MRGRGQYRERVEGRSGEGDGGEIVRKEVQENRRALIHFILELNLPFFSSRLNIMQGFPLLWHR